MYKRYKTNLMSLLKLLGHTPRVSFRFHSILTNKHWKTQNNGFYKHQIIYSYYINYNAVASTFNMQKMIGIKGNIFVSLC